MPGASKEEFTRRTVGTVLSELLDDFTARDERADGTWEPARDLGPLVNTARTEFCPVVSPDGRHLYFTSDRSFADKPLEAALSTREWHARLGGPGNGLGDTWRVPMSAVFEALGRTPR